MLGSIIEDMVIDMNEARLDTIEQIQEFLTGTADVDFFPCSGGIDVCAPS